MTEIQKRIMFLSLEGTGLGHLSRCSKVALALSKDHNCLIVTGLREAGWLLDQSLDFVKLPSLDWLVSHRAARLGCRPYFDRGDEHVAQFRGHIASTVASAFDPDILILDHTITGREGEFYQLIAHTRAKILLLLRPVLGNAASSVPALLSFGGTNLIGKIHSVLVTGDPRTSTIETELAGVFSRNKIFHIGYILDHPRLTHASIRSSKLRVICSAGSGLDSEDLYNAMSMAAASLSSEIEVEIVGGPHGQPPSAKSANISFTKEYHRLAARFMDSDLVVCHGGYNTLAEAMSARRPVIVYLESHADVTVSDERRIHCEKLASFYPITVVSNAAALELAIRTALKDATIGEFRSLLNVDGLLNIAEYFRNLEIHRPVNEERVGST
ncbi:hypothetical protein MUU53_22935 [Rhizobium lemnae]|uniref:Glycosyl transferase family 28 C-terminal domain-containing protein n=1 Tax=Rhizobium lemnae TaxID=1214924 RepID=A0ABV8EFB1_9HYPH|nr:hypothetical protein [Rhizobium lemnae]MCJ8510700.1 hypothetical protein [Rhizobium lemnae]